MIDLMPHALRRLLLAVSVVAVAGSLHAQFDETGDMLPGLLGKYTAQGVTIERLDPCVSFYWGTSAPDERLPAGEFEVDWTSQILMREEGLVTFHAYVEGALTVVLDGQTVLQADAPHAAWVSGAPVEATFGFLPLEVRYQGNAKNARAHLFWSSDSFPVEPLPQHLLFREEPRPDLALVHTGQVLFDAHRCNRCHQREHDASSPPAPGLFHVTDGLNRDWLIEKLRWGSINDSHSKMPDFGFSAEEAGDIAAWIDHFSQPADLVSIPKIKPPKEGPPEGDLLLKSLGCLACHTMGDEGTSGPWGGPDLTHIGAKRSREWMYTWLSQPEKINVQHRMPVVRLTPLERVSLVDALSPLGNTSKNRFDAVGESNSRETEQVKRGRELAQASRCAACHKIPAMEADLASIPSLQKPIVDWEKSCIGETADRSRHRPVYSQTDREALRAYVTSRFERPLSPLSLFDQGQSVLAQRNCLGCHERNSGKGIVPVAGKVSTSDTRLRGQSQALIPPALTAVGDKLHEQVLAEAVRGAQKAERLPWLKVRMPQFVHTPEDEQALLVFFIGRDRIPDPMPVVAGAATPAAGARETSTTIHSPATPEASGEHDEQTLLVGHALAGAGGFNCVACHQFGEYTPRNVALGTRGSDLLGIGRRMRREFFERWTRAPLRIIPGVEMPNFNKAVPGVLDDKVDLQLAALWDAIHDPRFKAPTNPTQVEQLLAVNEGERPRVVRDVFTTSGPEGIAYVVRPLAMGFNNGHSLLFDLDRFCVRGWTLGDFAHRAH